MALKYKVIARKNPSKPEYPPKYYPLVQSSGKITLRQLCKKAADISTLSPIDVMAAAELLLQIIPEELARGNRVQLGEFGTFTLKTQTKGVDAAEEVHARQIVGTSIAFRPGKEARKGLVDLSFEKMS